MSDPTIAELQAQIADAQSAIEQKMLQPIIEVCEAFSASAIQKAIEIAKKNLDMCNGEVRQQINNLIVVNTLSVEFLKNQAVQIDLRLNPIPVPADPEPQPAPEPEA